MARRRIIEQSRVKRDTEPRIYPDAREFTLDGIAPSAETAIRCKRVERERAFDVQASSNAAWLASRPSASTPSASPAGGALRAEEQRISRAKAIEARELAKAKALIAIPHATCSPSPEERAEERAREVRRDILQAERAAWSGADA